MLEPVEPAPFDIVAIGASAGGIEALHSVVTPLPSALPVAILIVQHLDPRHKSVLAFLLGRHARVPVKQAVHDEVIAPRRPTPPGVSTTVWRWRRSVRPSWSWSRREPPNGRG